MDSVYGIDIAIRKQRAHSPTFPSCLRNKRKEEIATMKNFKQLLFAAAFVAAVSVSASAQKEGDKKTPPPKEGKPPVIVVVPKEKPKEDKPKSDKKPQAIIFNGKVELAFF